MSRNFKSHFGVSQFSLYLKNGEDLSHQTVYRHFSFCYLESMLKGRLSKKQAVGSFENGFSGPKSFRNFRPGPGPVTPIKWHQLIAVRSNATGVMKLNDALKNEVVYLWFTNCTYIVNNIISPRLIWELIVSVIEVTLLKSLSKCLSLNSAVNWRSPVWNINILK